MNITDFPAVDATHMLVRGGVAVKALLRAGLLQANNLPPAFEQVQVSVNRTQTYLGHVFPHQSTYFFRSGVCVHITQLFQNKGALSGHSGLCHECFLVIDNNS